MAASATGRTAPGPRGHFLLGSLPDFQRDNVQTFMDAWHRYGDVVRFRGRGPMFLVVRPDDVRHVLQEHHPKYPRPPWVDDKLKGVVGDGLVANEGALWRRQRRL